MSKNPYFPLYTQDFLVGTMFFTAEEVGIYVRLLCVQHQHGGIIESSHFNSTVPVDSPIRTKFVETPDGFYNERLMREIIKATKKSSNLSANAKKRWEEKKQKNSNCNAIASDLQMPSESESENEIESENVYDNSVSSSEASENSGKFFEDDSDQMKLVEYFWKIAKEKHPTKKAYTPAKKQKYALEFDRMIRLDNADPKKLAMIIRDAGSDQFWCNVAFDPPKFRKYYNDGQFDRLNGQATKIDKIQKIMDMKLS